MPASGSAERAAKAEVSRGEIVWMLILSVALFALAFVAQGEIKAVIG